MILNGVISKQTTGMRPKHKRESDLTLLTPQHYEEAVETPSYTLWSYYITDQRYALDSNLSCNSSIAIPHPCITAYSRESYGECRDIGQPQNSMCSKTYHFGLSQSSRAPFSESIQGQAGPLPLPNPPLQVTPIPVSDTMRHYSNCRLKCCSLCRTPIRSVSISICHQQLEILEYGRKPKKGQENQTGSEQLLQKSVLIW